MTYFVTIAGRRWPVGIGARRCPTASALVGDSFTDIEAAHRVGVVSTGYANQPRKHDRVTQLQAGAVITSMGDLALSLRAHSRQL